MELRHLRYFVAVAEEQSVTRAASKLHVSQPPLSRQIRALEEELGVKLFHRTANLVRLNDAGRRFRTDAIAILRDADRAVKRIAAFGKDQAAEIRVGYSGLAASDILPELLRRFKSEAPLSLVKLRNMTFQESLEGLKKAKIDLALTVQSRIALPRKVRFEPLRIYRDGICLSKKHPLANCKEVNFSDVQREPLVTFSKKDYPHYHQFLKSMFRGTRLSPRIVQECDGYDSLLAAISSGYGITIMFELPRRLRPGIEFVPFRKGIEPMTVGILYRDEKHGPEIAAFFRAAQSMRSKRLSRGSD